MFSELVQSLLLLVCSVARATTTDRAAQPGDRVVGAVRHPLLERDDRVVGDVDAFRTYLRAALGDVAVADAGLLAEQLTAVVGVQRVHLELGVLDEHARPGEA